MPKGYDHREIEKRAQEKWAALDLYTTDLTDSTKDPYYLLFEFPYPSGDLHIGHWYAFALTDIYARFLRMKGKNVLFPIGFDSFGLPAENAAMKNGADPREWTYANMDRMRAQIRTMGTSVDWSKEVVTSDPEYYHWTQWLFSKLFEHDLAERREAAVKWCPKDQTVLANEQVIDGRCDRCGTEVVEKRLTQWFMKITQYAERLLSDLDALPWREDIKDAQRAWIGKSEGAKLSFKVVPAAESDSETAAAMPDVSIEVFTTRPDTLYGATYVVLAPEHKLLNELLEVLENETDVSAYINETKRKTERERQEQKEKTGVRLEGVMAVNPVNGENIPVFVADYVLGSYGTGAVMAVPAHDERDYAFAKKFGLPIKQVVARTLRRESGKDAVRGDAVWKERNAVMCIVKHWERDELLCLQWKDHPDVRSFVSGGIEEGETAVEAGIREIKEETGYLHPKFVRTFDESLVAEFYHQIKKQNVSAHFEYLYFELEDGEQIAMTEEDAKNHEMSWKSPAEAFAFISHLEKDWVFESFNGKEAAYTGDGKLINSGEYSGKNNREALWDIVSKAGGERTTNYRMRDWLVSRQRYWGCPIPVVYDPEGKPRLVPADHLPWLLPTDVDFTPTGKPPLASSKELHERVTRLFGEGWTPEYDTLDTFVDSSWYFLRYLDPKDSHDFSDQSLMKKWMPVNRYSGGAEHTTMHLLYSRFFNKALYDLALVPTSEPYHERFNRGIIMGPDGQKMSKSKGNVVNPDEVVKEFGADAVRLYLAFIGPYNEPGHYPWNLDGVSSMRKFLERITALSDKLTDAESSENVMRMFAKAEAKANGDTDRFKFNTAISALMILVRDLEGEKSISQSAYHGLLRMMAPYAPHLMEELWEKAGGEGSVHQALWPSYDDSLLVEDEVSIIVQVNGKKRGEVRAAKDADESAIYEEAMKIDTVSSFLAGKEVKKQVYVPGRILNLVTD